MTFSKQDVLRFFPSYYAEAFGIDSVLLDAVYEVFLDLHSQMAVQDKDGFILFSEIEQFAVGNIDVTYLADTIVNVIIAEGSIYTTMEGISYRTTQIATLQKGLKGTVVTIPVKSDTTDYTSNIEAGRIVDINTMYSTTNAAPITGARPGLLHELARNRGYNNTVGMSTQDIRKLIRAPSLGVTVPRLEAGVTALLPSGVATIENYWAIPSDAIGINPMMQNHTFVVNVPKQVVAPVGFALGISGIGLAPFGVVLDTHEQFLASVRDYLEKQKAAGKEFLLAEAA